jgi:four helix bundle protein
MAGVRNVMPFDHEKLDVYQLAIEFVARANEVIEQLPRGRGYLADQLQRAALSIVLNIAEGAGKFSPADKAVFYTRARASATESAAVLDACRKLNLIATPVADDNKAVLERIARMLTKLIKSRRPPE